MAEENISPLAKRLAEENNVEWQKLTGTGEGGKVVERDVLDFLSRVMAGEEDVNPTPEPLPEGMSSWGAEANGVATYTPEPTPAPFAADTAAENEPDIDEGIFLFDDDPEPELAADDDYGSGGYAPQAAQPQPSYYQDDRPPMVDFDFGDEEEQAEAQFVSDEGAPAAPSAGGDDVFGEMSLGAEYVEESASSEESVPAFSEEFPGEISKESSAEFSDEFSDEFSADDGGATEAFDFGGSRAELREVEVSDDFDVSEDFDFGDSPAEDPGSGRTEDAGFFPAADFTTGQSGSEEFSFDPAGDASADQGGSGEYGYGSSADVLGEESDSEEFDFEPSVAAEPFAADEPYAHDESFGEPMEDDETEPVLEVGTAQTAFDPEPAFGDGGLEPETQSGSGIDPEVSMAPDTGIEPDTQGAFVDPLQPVQPDSEEATGGWAAESDGLEELLDQDVDLESVGVSFEEEQESVASFTPPRPREPEVSDQVELAEVSEELPVPQEEHTPVAAAATADAFAVPADSLILRRELRLRQLRSVSRAVADELAASEEAVTAALLLRAAALAAGDSAFAVGQLGLATYGDTGVQVDGTVGPEGLSFRELVERCESTGAGEPGAGQELALVVADLSALGIDDAHLRLGAPLLTLGRSMRRGRSGTEFAFLALSGEFPVAQGAQLLERVAERLQEPVRLLL